MQTDLVPTHRCHATRTARWTLRLTGVLALLAYVLLAPGLAHAAGIDESTPLYDVTITVARDGVTHVNERITYDFAGNEHHGIYRTIPVVYDYPPKPGYNRVLEISNIKVSSDAPHDVKTERDGRNLVIRIGDPHKTVTGKHLYILNYDVKGALNRFDGHVQLDWNALGTAWEVPVAKANVVVRFPVAATSVVCFRGPSGASLPCETATVKSGVVHAIAGEPRRL